MADMKPINRTDYVPTSGHEALFPVGSMVEFKSEGIIMEVVSYPKPGLIFCKWKDKDGKIQEKNFFSDQLKAYKLSQI